jgi:branched-chain amino acid transport system substrate-binding protein
MKMKHPRFALLILVMTTLLVGACNDTSNYKDTVILGAILGLTGNSGSLGEDTKNGIQLAIDEQNAKGGILGKKILLDVQDSKTDGNTAVNIAKQMLEGTGPKPIAIYTQSSVTSVPVKPIAEKNKTIMFAISGAEKLLENARYPFRNWANPQVASHMIVNFMADSLHSKTVGIFFCNNDYGKSMQKYVAGDCDSKGIAVSFSSAFDEKDGEYKSLIAEYVFKNKRLDCIYTVGLGSGLGILTKQIREAGYTGQIISDITAPYPNVLNAAGEAGKGMYYLDFAYSNSSTAPTQKQYHEAFVKAYGKEPLNFSVVSYEALRLLFKAIEKANTFDPEKVVASLNAITNTEGVFGNITIQNNEINYLLDIKQVK